MTFGDVFYGGNLGQIFKRHGTAVADFHCAKLRDVYMKPLFWKALETRANLCENHR